MMASRLWSLSLVAIASCPLLVATSCSTAPATVEQVGATKSALQSAALDMTTTSVLGVYNAQGGGSICSGVLIAPNLALTTRHCVDAVPDSLNCTNGSFLADAEAPNNVLSITSCDDISKRAAAPCDFHRSEYVYRPDSGDLCGADIALVRLTEPITNVVLAVPNLDPVVAPDAPGATSAISLFGFGADDGALQNPGFRRRRDGVAIACWGTTPTCMLNNTPVGVKEFATGGIGTCQGDSGGPAGILDSSGVLHITGIIARGGSDGTSCLGGAYTRVDSWRDFIVASAIDAAAIGKYPKPAWAKAAPKAFGVACGGNDECASALCSGGICTHTCGAEAGSEAGSDCESGLACNADGICATPVVVPPPPPVRASDGCACATFAGQTHSGGLVAGAAFIVAAWRRRKRRRRNDDSRDVTSRK